MSDRVENGLIKLLKGKLDCGWQC